MDVDTVVNERSTDLLEMRISMIDHLCSNNEAHFKSQQKHEPDLTLEEKREIAETLLDNNPGQFLSRFGKYLSESHLDYFTQLAVDNYEVNFYFKELKSKFSRSNKKSVIRNRRLEALRRLTNDGEYFSDDEMRKRNPVMFEHLVGQYLSEEEKIHVQSNKTENQSFLEFLLNAIDEREIKERLKVEAIEEEEEEDDDDGDDDCDLDYITREQNVQYWGEHFKNEAACSGNGIKIQEDIPDNEKALLMNEFRSHVYSDFLGGKDTEFDYSKVDSNHDYDDLEMLEIDQQDKYFDSETPEMLSKGDASSDSSTSYDPPRCLIQKMEDLGK